MDVSFCEEFKDLLGDSNENVHKMCFSEGFKILLIWLPLNWSPLKEERTSSANNKLIDHFVFKHVNCGGTKKIITQTVLPT